MVLLLKSSFNQFGNLSLGFAPFADRSLKISPNRIIWRSTNIGHQNDRVTEQTIQTALRDQLWGGGDTCMKCTTHTHGIRSTSTQDDRWWRDETPLFAVKTGISTFSSLFDSNGRETHKTTTDFTWSPNDVQWSLSRDWDWVYLSRDDHWRSISTNYDDNNFHDLLIIPIYCVYYN